LLHWLTYRFAAAGLLCLAIAPNLAWSQAVDCPRLQAEIARVDDRPRTNRAAADTQRQRAELDRAISSARQLGCNRPQLPFFDNSVSARCPALNAQIAQMQGSLAQSQAGAVESNRSAYRADLIARFNAYCRGATPTQARPRNFFEQLFSGFQPSPAPAPAPWIAPEPDPNSEPEQAEDARPHGGSLAVCVRSCDGGFFPLSVSARHADADKLSELCTALCPNAAVSVYTKSPSKPIDDAAALSDGASYSDLPNALKFQKSFDPACTCKPPDQSWAEALAEAERVLGQQRKGDIVVTEEKSAELAAGKSDPKPSSASAEPAGRAGKTRTRKETAAPPSKDAPKASADTASPDRDLDDTQEIVGPDGIKRRVRKVGPLL
jgi:hypothetical protein